MRRSLLATYYYGTYPFRQWRARVAAAAGKSPVLVLTYHRIADDRASSWTLATDVFIQHMQWLRRNFDLVSFEEAQARLRRRHNARPCVSVTFDDGYAENCDRALPFLIEERIPCTYFVATRFVLEQQPFPHDAAMGIHAPPNTLEQLRQLAAAGVELGGHSRSHCDLGAIADRARLENEIAGCRDDIENALGYRCRYFAFPFGMQRNLSSLACDVARSAGYEGVCSAYNAYNFPGDYPFHVRRGVIERGLLNLKNWTTIDPRYRRVPPFQAETILATDHKPAGNMA